MSLKQKREFITLYNAFRFPGWSFPIVLLAISILGYGLLIPWLGFYWDDLPSIWFLHEFGPAGFREVFASDRPLLGFLFNLTTSILGESIFNWQLFGLITHWFAGVTLWWTLSLLWPKQSRQTAWVATLFTMYPGFSQQSISVTYSHIWLILAIFIASLGLMLLAIRTPRHFWLLMTASWLSSAIAMFSVEYFFTLEMLRPVFLWITLSGNEDTNSRRIKKSLTYWLPFLILMVLFLFWRFILHEFPRASLIETSQITSSPLSGSMTLVRMILEDSVEAGIKAWYLPFSYFANINIRSTAYLVAVFSAVLSAAFTFIFFSRYHPQVIRNQRANFIQSWGFTAMLLGIYALLTAGWPYWLTNLLIKLEFPNDRFTIAMILGSSLLIVGMIDLIPRAFYLKIGLISLLTGVSVGMHLNYANTYRLEWVTQKDFFWQLSWRMPQIEPGTIVMAAQLPFRYFSDNSLTAPLNWVYSSETDSENMAYLIYDIQSRRGNNPERFGGDEPIYQPYRATEFHGTTSQALVFMYSPPGCLNVLALDSDQDNPDIPRQTKEALHLSNLDNIITNSESRSLPDHIFGSEPAHGWCFYVQKVDLAGQNDDWETAALNADSALDLDTNLYPINASELVGFIEAYAYTAQWDKAVNTTILANRVAFKRSLEDNTPLYPLRPMLCNVWVNLKENTPKTDKQEQTIETIKRELNCDQL